MKTWRHAVLALLAMVQGCSGDEATGRVAKEQAGKLATGIVAAVADELVDARTVAAIAQRQSVSLRDARDRAIYDAVFAAAARRQHPKEADLARSRVLARALARAMWLEARTQPITDKELAEATAERFVEYDRPPGWRVVHSVVRIYERYKSKKREAAKLLADAVFQKAEPIAKEAADSTPPKRKGKLAFEHANPANPSDPAANAFKAAVKALPHGKLEVVTEVLPVLAKDGRYIDYHHPVGSGVVPAFARAAASLSKRGDIVRVTSKFGHHTIILLERTGPKRVARAERLRQLRASIQFNRARWGQAKLLHQLKQKMSVSTTSNADAPMALIDAEDFGAERAEP